MKKRNVVIILTHNLEDVSGLCEKMMEMEEGGVVTVFFNTERLKREGGYAELRDHIECYEDDGCKVVLIFVAKSGEEPDYARLVVNRPTHIPVIFLGAKSARDENAINEIAGEIKEIFKTKRVVGLFPTTKL